MIRRPMRRAVRAVPAIPAEHTEQVALFRWAKLAAGAHPELRLMFAVPNGGHRHKATAGRLKAEGVKSGVPDIILPVARGGFHGLYLELKRQKGTRPTAEQRQWLADLEAEGYRTDWCRGWEPAREVIVAYLALPRVLSGSISEPAVSP